MRFNKLTDGYNSRVYLLRHCMCIHLPQSKACVIKQLLFENSVPLRRAVYLASYMSQHSYRRGGDHLSLYTVLHSSVKSHPRLNRRSYRIIEKDFKNCETLGTLKVETSVKAIVARERVLRCFDGGRCSECLFVPGVPNEKK